MANFLESLFGGLFGDNKKKKPQVTQQQVDQLRQQVIANSPKVLNTQGQQNYAQRVTRALPAQVQPAVTQVRPIAAPRVQQFQAPRQTGGFNLGDLIKSAGNFTGQVNDATLGTANKFIGSLPKAAGEFGKGVGETTVGIAQAIPRGVRSLGNDVRGDKEFIPTTIGDKILFGNAPIKNSEGVGSDTLGIVGLNGNSLANKVVGTALNVLDATPVGVAGVKAAEKVAPVVAKAVKEPAIKAAESSSGLARNKVVNDNEAYTLSDFADYVNGRHLADTTDPKNVRQINTLGMQARNAAKSAGIDITSGTPRQVQERIASYLEARDSFKNSQTTVAQGGYIKVPGADNTPDLDGELNQLHQQLNTEPDPLVRQELAKAATVNRIEKVKATKNAETSSPVGQQIVRDIPEQQLPVQTKTTAQELVPNPANNLDLSYPQSSINKSNNQVPPVSNGSNLLTGGAEQKTRFASRTAPQSGNLSPELAQAVKENASSYARSTNEGSLADSLKFLNEKGFDEASNDVLNRLNGKAIDRQTVTDALSTASALDVLGDETSLRTAQVIYDKLSEQLTKSGKTVQAASIINRRTPQGLLVSGQKALNEAGVEVTPEMRKELIDLSNEIGKYKLGTSQRDNAVATFQKAVNKNIPSELVDKIVGTWKAGLLTGIRTTTGGALSNALFRGLREVSRPGAVALDMLTSAITGKRSVALTARGALSGTGEGIKKGAQSLKTGIDERSFTADGKYLDRELNFKNKALNTYVNGVFRVMGAADRPFYYSQFRNSLNEAAIVEAKNLKLSGKERAAYIVNAIENPSEEALQYATNNAEQSVLANQTFLSDVANKLKSAADKQENPAAKATAKAVTGILLPFTKVPSAFLTRVMDFTPVGAVKEVVQQAASKKLDQAKLVQAISEAGTGTGIIYLGAELANNNLLSGSYPDDPTEQARWKAEGITPNSIKIGDTWYSLNYAGPFGSLFQVGKTMRDAAAEGADAAGAISAGIGQLATGTLDQSFLSGVSGALDAIKDPKRYAENFVRSQAGSVVPTLANDVGVATDDYQRQANSPLEAIQSRVPGLRNGLDTKQDVFGQDIKRADPNALDSLWNPLRPSQSRSNSLTNELDRLKETGNSTFPTADKTIKAGSETVKLDPKQQRDFNGRVGQETDLLWQNVLNSQEYSKLDDTNKKKMLDNAATDIAALSKKEYLTEIGRQDLADKIKLTKRQQKYAEGDISASLWAPKDEEATATSSTTRKPKKTSSVKTTRSKRTTALKKAKASRTARKGTGKARVGFKAPSKGAFKQTQSTAAIRRLLANAGSQIG